MPIKLLIFLGAILLLVFGMHYAFFRSMVHFFSITRPAAKISIYLAMAALSLSFVTAFFMLHWQANIWTIWYYRLAAVWTGFLIHFLVAVTLIWVVIGLFKLAGVSGSRQTVTVIFLSLTVLYSAYSLWRTFHPCVREITIGFENLPADWDNSRIVQLSDVHLGCIHGKQFADRIVARVNGLNPDLIFITGDLFDGVNGHYTEFIEPLNRLRARHGIFFITGNHEHYIGIDKALALIKKTGFRILDNELVTINGLEVVGISYPGISSLDEIANLPENNPPSTAGQVPSDHARILLFHIPANIQKNSGDDGDQHIANYWMPDTSFALNKKLNCDLQLSGHTHHGQIFPLNLVSRLLYKKYDYGLKHHGSLRIYTTCGTGSWGPPLRSPLGPEIVLIRPVKASD